LIDILRTEYSIDQKRIYATGTSNGGYFSFELACHLSHRIAAVASSAGLMSDRTYNSCDPKHPTPILQIHGTADNVVGYDGNTPVNSLSVDEVLDYWIKFNGTDRTPAITSLPDTDPSNGNTSESQEYNQGKNCTSVHHYKVTGGGHILAGLNGNVDIDIMGIIWNFLTQYDINGLIDCPTVSTKEPETKSRLVRIYPNPTKDNIKIVSPSINNQAYSLYDSFGRIIYTGTTIHGNASLDLRELSPDIYILTIQNQTIKIIKR
ncbi:MAG: T9SS type A sorting domain-containing protein, partial [Bacteroidia bacterium]